jgi:hypothetical protein
LSFFDEGDEPRTQVRASRPPARRPPARGGRQRTDDRTLLVRRGAAAAIILIVLIGIVLAVRAVLNHQAIAGLKSYESNVTQLVEGEQQAVRLQFFHELDNDLGSSNTGEVATALQQYISQEQSYYHEAQGWSVPAQMVGGQRWFVEELGLRYEALEGIEAEITTALVPSQYQARAIKLIAGDMYKLGASDIMYSDRAQPLINEALAKAGVAGTVPKSPFLPDITWIVPQTLAQRMLGYVPTSLGGSKPPAGTLVGHHLVGVSVQSSSGALTPLVSGINKLPYTTAGITFVLTLENAGDLAEHGVITKVYFTKAGVNTGCLTKTNAIETTDPGTTYHSPILFAPTCSTFTGLLNQVLSMTAEVVPVIGETDKSNNFQSYDVEFER